MLRKKTIKENTALPLADYWDGIQRSLESRVSSLRAYLKYPVSGSNIEAYFRDLLRDYLPRRYSVETGFVVNSEGVRSNQIDIIIADLHNIAPLCSEPLLKVFPAESVVAAIEVTSSPKSSVKRNHVSGRRPKLQDDILKLAHLRELARLREYKDKFPHISSVEHIDQIDFSILPLVIDQAPRTFLITCGDEWAKREVFEKNALEALDVNSKINNQTWINAVFSVRHGMLWFKPNTNFQCEWRTENALLEFVMFVNKAISTYQTFCIDIGRYRPKLPKA